MSIRLRLTLLYSAILALTLIIFGIALYTVQAQYTLDSLKRDLQRSGDNLVLSLRWRYLHPRPLQAQPEAPPPMPLDTLSSEQSFNQLREREIVRVLNPDGGLVASPSGVVESALPLSAVGLQSLRNQQVVWEFANFNGERLLIYNRPGVINGEVVFITQAARALTERDRSLAALSRTLLIAGVLTTLAAFGIGWALAGTTLRPIQRITQTAQEIGNESDFTRRVDYSGPKDEIGELALTFNAMLTRLEEAYQRVSQTLKMQRNFVADVSHELRTPLTTVRGNLALLRRDPPLPAVEQTDVLSDLVDESDRLIRLVNDLLVLARADSGNNLQQEPVAVRPLVEETCRQVRLLDQQREIVENMQDVSVLGDRDALKQVLLILMDNGLKHSQGAIAVSAETVGKQVMISVRDRGPGMAPDTLEHVFDRFYRGEAAQEVNGFGLGLPIAKALVEAQGGKISLESQVPLGTVVRVYLPRSSV
jgi:two-component system, OmpR family, sensor kinase